MIENEYTKSKIERNPAKTNKLKSETGEIQQEKAKKKNELTRKLLVTEQVWQTNSRCVLVARTHKHAHTRANTTRFQNTLSRIFLRTTAERSDVIHLKMRAKKKIPSLDFCIWTKKRPLNNLVMFIFLYSRPIKYDAKFLAQNCYFLDILGH